MDKGSEQSGPLAQHGANGGEAAPRAAAAHRGMQPTYDWQAAFQAFYGQGQRQPGGPGASEPAPPYPWGGQSMPPNLFGSGFPGPPFPGAYGPYAANPGAAFEPSPSQKVIAQMSGGSSLQRDNNGSLGSLGNLLKSNGESPSRSSGASDSTQDEEKGKGDTDLSPGLRILRKRSFEHMGLDAVAAGGTGFPAYVGRGAFASASSLDPSVAPSKVIAVARSSAMQSPLQRNDSATGDETWLQMGQGTDSGGLDLDDKEVRKQRRKQSNRESARRSRLRKQAECEELSGRVDHLSNENLALRAELVRLGEQCTQLASDNRVLQDELLRVRNRGQTWRPSEGVSARPSPSSGGVQARRDKPPLGPASQEKVTHRSSADQDSAKGEPIVGNSNGQPRQVGENSAGHPAPSRTAAASPVEEARAVNDKQAEEGMQRSWQSEEAPLPAVEVRVEKGAANEGPPTPGPTLTSSASSPGRNKPEAWPSDGRESGRPPKEQPSDGGKQGSQGDDREGGEKIERSPGEGLQQPRTAGTPS